MPKQFQKIHQFTREGIKCTSWAGLKLIAGRRLRMHVLDCSGGLLSIRLLKLLDSMLASHARMRLL